MSTEQQVIPTPEQIETVNQTASSVDGWIAAAMALLFHPLMVVHAGSWLVTQMLKHFIAQWIPLWFYNKVFSRVVGVSTRAHTPTALRYVLSITLAGVVAYVMTLFFWPDAMQINGYSKDQIAFINAIFSPLLFFIVMKTFKKSNILALNTIAEWFGAKDLNWHAIERYKNDTNRDDIDDKVMLLKQALGIEDEQDLTIRIQKRAEKKERDKE